MVIGGLLSLMYLRIPFERKFFYYPSTKNLIKSLTYYVNSTGWKLVLLGNTDGKSSASFEMIEGDTLKHIIFSLDERESGVDVIRFTKSFENANGRHSLRLNSRDTLYYFTVTKRNDTLFSTGEYYYRFANFQMTKSESDYYVLHMDSLKKIKGDNLPMLPSLK